MLIEGLNRFRQTLTKLASRYGKPKCSVVVGYTQRYAIYVHEIPAKHSPGQEYKYLEKPARRLSNDSTLSNLTRRALQGGATLEEALLIPAMRIQRDSQKIVPVDTGALKGSAFVAKEADIEMEAARAFGASEAARSAGKAKKGRKK